MGDKTWIVEELAEPLGISTSHLIPERAGWILSFPGAQDGAKDPVRQVGGRAHPGATVCLVELSRGVIHSVMPSLGV